MVSEGGETFLWQLVGDSNIIIGNEECKMAVDDVLLIPLDSRFQVSCSEEGIIMSCKMSANNKFRVNRESQHC